MIELGGLSSQTCFDISEALSIGQLGKGQSEKMLPARKTLDLVVALVALHAEAKLVSGRKKVHQLSKDRFARIHPKAPSTKMLKYGFG